MKPSVIILVMVSLVGLPQAPAGLAAAADRDLPEVGWRDGGARLRDVEILLVGTLERPVEVTAEEGLVYLDSEDFELRGNVEGTTDRGERFETERVRYTKGSQELVGDGPVKVARDGLDFTGNGMRIDLETREIRFTGRVRATIAPR